MLFLCSVLHLALAPSALGLRRAAVSIPPSGSSSGEELPKESQGTAILLVGQMAHWEDHIDGFISRMSEPNKADVFIHTTGLPEGLVERLGSSLKAAVDEVVPDPCPKPYKQFYHLEKAFELMTQHEAKNHFQYDIVVRARSDMVPAPPSQLDLSEWRPEERDKMYMMTDMIFWGVRDSMDTACRFWSGIHDYYMRESPDPYNRTIPVWRFWDSLRRDPYLTRPNEYGQESYKWYQKFSALPYPYMGHRGYHYGNLRMAVDHGMITWSPAQDPEGKMSLTSGRVRKVEPGRPFNPVDYTPANPRVEKDLLHWIMIHNMTICDIGPSMRWLKVKGSVISRNMSSDCSIKQFENITRPPSW
eukprot:CAMPEP_0204524534 /NCGR_PEP_ID=MMETSP0661-20131031/7423_1 /ASSEMBLY_ACC=CAM_ASM_000606 /TAXON_ID=109239 /ORGANISM="Alexandrium margalefi, Strain AMGDE01CS-322" /LENGTH=358 /DNA_ID=CAMNT_0051530291 /DNA_START=84 /DNA_END=1161 /DNA_ORIENTATION=-